MQNDRIAAGQSENGEFGVLTIVPRHTAVESLSSEVWLKKALDSTLLEGMDDLRFRTVRPVPDGALFRRK